eukprot:s101_g19.t2
MQILKVSSHQDKAQLSNIVEEWAARGNDAADLHAARAKELLPACVLHAHAILSHELQLRYAACAAFHRLLVDIGLKVVHEKEETRKREAEAWETVIAPLPTAADLVSLQPWPTTLSVPEDHTMGDGLTLLYQWIQIFSQGPRAQPMWVSSYQLYAHFQNSMNHLGFHYNRKTKQYEEIPDTSVLVQFPFLRAAGWFYALLKCFAKTLGLTCNIQSRMPSGTTLKCWQRCILIEASPATIQGVDKMFSAKGITLVKSVHTAFRQCTVLHFIALNGDTDLFREAVNDPKADEDLINIRDKLGDTALTIAAITGYVDILADVEAKNLKGRTALLLAAEHGHSDAVQMLLMANAELDPGKGTTCPSAMYLAELNQRDGVVKTIVQHLQDMAGDDEF